LRFPARYGQAGHDARGEAFVVNIRDRFAQSSV